MENLAFDNRRTFIMSDTIQQAYLGWMHDDHAKSFNLASLAMWRAANKNLWIMPDEERFLKVALDNPPV